ncbi:transcriptional regulator [Rugosimonospora africana]|uniref:Transcriptional regulator n=1 Tax=Rugosimonospora africana TaxID=556532 RepID=A0A8J3VVX7_9ACTN|nr:transcriptional regulator [Rugosimonospora africana]
MEETAQTLDRGLRLLQLVADAPGGLTVTEAANRLGVGRSVVYRLAATLAMHGMIRRDDGGQLRIGAGVLHLARRAQPLIADATLPVLRRLAEQVGATAHLTVADGAGQRPTGGPGLRDQAAPGEAVALAVVEPSWTALHVAYRAGSRHPLDHGAAGLAILAGRRGESGWVETNGQLQAGAYGIAAPVLGVPGLEASVGVVALAPLDAQVVGPAVIGAAAATARALAPRTGN